jgi:biotin operon repressor
MKPVAHLLGKYESIVLKGFDPVTAGGFTQIPNILLRTPDLSSQAKIVYAQLLSYAWSSDRCFPGQERMGEDLGASRTTIYRALQELQAAGWLEVERRGQGKTNVYVLKYVVDNPRNGKADVSKVKHQESRI